jgi:lysophospholipase L1-like esterase
MKKTNKLKIVFALSLACNLALVFYAFHKAAWKVRQHSQQASAVSPRIHRGSEPNTIRYAFGRDLVFRALPDDSNSIIFVGNSLTQLFELGELFRNPRIKNRGIIGDNSRGVLLRLDEITKRRPAKVFLEIGINDLTSGYPVDSVNRNCREIVRRIKRETPGAKIYLQSILPANVPGADRVIPLERAIVRLNDSLRSLAQEEGCVYIDLYSSFIIEAGRLDPRYDCGDGLHLNGEGYLKWRNLIKRYIDE